jgi:hypothetical protein
MGVLRQLLGRPRGHVDVMTVDEIAGWAVTAYGEPAMITLCADGRHVLSMLADRPREDLAALGLSKGLGGFSTTFKPYLKTDASTRIDVQLGGRLIRTATFPPIPSKAPEARTYVHEEWLRAEVPWPLRLRIVGNDLTFATGPRSPSVLRKMISCGGWQVVDDADSPAIVFDRNASPVSAGAINGGGIDNDKASIAVMHPSIFGWTLAVDPRTHAGPIVVKSRRNAAHDGKVVTAPVDLDHDQYVAQLAINNQRGGMVQDIRVPYFAGVIPFVYFKYRPIESRFSNKNAAVAIAAASAAFDEDELGKLHAFAAACRLDYGEMDVLRDTESGRIYVVDVNNTPAGPPNALPAEEAIVAVRIMTGAFEAAFLRGRVLRPPIIGS